MNRLTLLLILLIPTITCIGQEVVFEEPEDDEFPSQQETKYYEKNKYTEFKPAAISFINKLKYDYLTFSEVDTKNRFTNVWEKTNYGKYFDSLDNICIANRNKIEDTRDREVDREYSECIDSIRTLRYSKKIGDIFYNSILRYDSLNSLKIILYKDGELEEIDFGYWLTISKDNGKSWKKYYTGLVENNFYYIKPNPKIRLIINESTIQIEFAIVRKTKQETLPVGAPEYELVRDNLVMKVNLKKLTSDKDNDGLTDVLENKFFTNPVKKDTDNDGINDGDDKNPRYRDVANRYSVLYKYILEYASMDSALVSLNNFKFKERGENQFEVNRTYLIVTDDNNLVNLTGTRSRYIIMTTKEFKVYKRTNIVPLQELGVSPTFDIDNKPGQKKIRISGGFWGHDYLIIERRDGWFVKFIGGYII